VQTWRGDRPFYLQEVYFVRSETPVNFQQNKADMRLENDLSQNKQHFYHILVRYERKKSSYLGIWRPPASERARHGILWTSRFQHRQCCTFSLTASWAHGGPSAEPLRHNSHYSTIQTLPKWGMTTPFLRASSWRCALQTFGRLLKPSCLAWVHHQILIRSLTDYLKARKHSKMRDSQSLGSNNTSTISS